VSASARVQLAGRRLERIPADLTLVGVTRDERPLRGGAGRVDWRLCGLLSELALEGHLTGDLGEAILLPGTGRLSAGRVLVLGVGPRERLTSVRVEEVVAIAITRSLELGAGRVALAALGWSHDEWPRHAASLMHGLARALDSWPGEAVLQLRLAVPEDDAAPTARALGSARLALRQRAVQIELVGDATTSGGTEPRDRTPRPAEIPRGEEREVERPIFPSPSRY